MALFGPSLVVVLVIVAFNVLGDGLRDTLDPRTRQGGGRRPEERGDVADERDDVLDARLDQHATTR